MAAGVSWSRRALADLREIAGHIAQDSPAAAEDMKERLRIAGDSLSEFPERGRRLRGSIRQLVVVRPYLIVYQADVDPIRILQIRHGARRPL